MSLRNFTRTLLPALLCLALVWSGCSEQRQLEQNLQGTWQADSFEGEGEEDQSGQTGSYVSVSQENAGQFTFRTDGSGSHSLSFEFEISNDGNTTTIDATSTGNFNWTNDDNSILLQYDDGRVLEMEVQKNESEAQLWSGKIRVEALIEKEVIEDNITHFTSAVLDIEFDFLMECSK